MYSLTSLIMICMYSCVVSWYNWLSTTSVYFLYNICVLSLHHLCTLSTTSVYFIYNIRVLYLQHPCILSTTSVYFIYNIRVLYLQHMCTLSTTYVYFIYNIRVLYLQHMCTLSTTSVYFTASFICNIFRMCLLRKKPDINYTMHSFNMLEFKLN